MATKYQLLVDHVVARSEGAVTLSFTEIEAIVGSSLPTTMQVDTALWNSSRYAIVWRLADREMAGSARPAQSLRPLHPRRRGVGNAVGI